MKYILFILLALLTLQSQVSAKAFDLVVTPSHEEDLVKKETQKNTFIGKKLLIMISSGELEKAGMGFTLGLNATKRGIQVTYVIGAKALHSARIKGKQNKFLAKGMTHREILQEAIKKGARVQICGMCAKSLGLTNQDFIKGSQIINSKVIFDKMYEDGVKVLNF